MLAEITIVLCLKNDPAKLSCDEITQKTFQTEMEDPNNAVGCMMMAETAIAPFLEDYPKYNIQSWTCTASKDVKTPT